MYKFLVLPFLLFAVSCSPSPTEVQRQQVEYDRIADSVLKASENLPEPVQDLAVDTTSIKDSLK